MCTRFGPLVCSPSGRTFTEEVQIMSGRPRRAPEEPYQSLFSNSKAGNNGPVSGNVLVLQIIEQASPLPDHH
jgi:hypothetical protein